MGLPTGDACEAGAGLRPVGWERLADCLVTDRDLPPLEWTL